MVFGDRPRLILEKRGLYPIIKDLKLSISNRAITLNAPIFTIHNFFFNHKPTLNIHYNLTTINSIS